MVPACLNIVDTTLLDFLYVVSEIGGRCCLTCCQPGKSGKSNSGRIPKIILNTEHVNEELQTIKAQLASISECLHSSSSNALSADNSTALMSHESSAGPRNIITYAQVAGSIPTTTSNVPRSSTSNKSNHSTLEETFRTAVLTAVHSELLLKSRRSNNIVVTGLPISSMASDQFIELCESELNTHPNVCSTIRLGEATDGKIQPLSICLESPEDVEKMMPVAQ